MPDPRDRQRKAKERAGRQAIRRTSRTRSALQSNPATAGITRSEASRAVSIRAGAKPKRQQQQKKFDIARSRAEIFKKRGGLRSQFGGPKTGAPVKPVARPGGRGGAKGFVPSQLEGHILGGTNIGPPGGTSLAPSSTQLRRRRRKLAQRNRR